MAIWTAIISSFSVLAGVTLAHFFEARRRSAEQKSQEKKWYAEQIMGRKIETLTQLYQNLTSVYTTVIEGANVSPQNPIEYLKTLIAKHKAYVQSFMLAYVYFDEKTKDYVTDSINVITKTLVMISMKYYDRETAKNIKQEMESLMVLPGQHLTDEAEEITIDLDILSLSVSKAIVALQSHLHPDAIGKWIDELAR